MLTGAWSQSPHGPGARCSRLQCAALTLWAHGQADIHTAAGCRWVVVKETSVHACLLACLHNLAGTRVCPARLCPYVVVLDCHMRAIPEDHLTSPIHSIQQAGHLQSIQTLLLCFLHPARYTAASCWCLNLLPVCSAWWRGSVACRRTGHTAAYHDGGRSHAAAAS